MFDRRGLGLSDPIVDWERPVLEHWTDDLAAVIEAVGAEDAVVFAWEGYGVGSSTRPGDRTVCDASCSISRSWFPTSDGTSGSGSDWRS